MDRRGRAGAPLQIAEAFKFPRRRDPPYLQQLSAAWLNRLELGDRVQVPGQCVVLGDEPERVLCPELQGDRQEYGIGKRIIAVAHDLDSLLGYQRFDLRNDMPCLPRQQRLGRSIGMLNQLVAVSQRQDQRSSFSEAGDLDVPEGRLLRLIVDDLLATAFITIPTRGEKG